MFVSDINLYGIFEGLDESESSLILKISQKKLLAQGEYLFREDSSGDRVYLIYEGEVEIMAKDNEETVLAKIDNRDVIGEFALFDDAPRSVIAKTATDIIFWEVHTEDLFDLFEENPKVGMVVLRNLGKIMASRLRRTDMGLRNSLLWTQSGSPTE
jgi:CRP-like cAMP-binding protein